MTLDANYVGSNGRHEDWGPTLNVPRRDLAISNRGGHILTCCSNGSTRAWATAATTPCKSPCRNMPTHGVTFLAAYTLSHANADGCNLGASCESQNPYDRHSDYGTSDLNEKNVFSVAFTAESPYDKSPNKLLSNVAGGWALNGIVQETSGTALPGERRRRSFEYRLLSHRKDERTGNPNGGSGIHTQKEWFNTSAFTAPTGYTYGNEKVNSLRLATFQRCGLSLFRDFHLGLGEERYFEFRAESFNLFNNVVFNTPNTSFSGLGLLNPPPAGTIPTTPYVTNPATNQFGNVTSQ